MKFSDFFFFLFFFWELSRQAPQSAFYISYSSSSDGKKKGSFSETQKQKGWNKSHRKKKEHLGPRGPLVNISEPFSCAIPVDSRKLCCFPSVVIAK